MASNGLSALLTAVPMRTRWVSMKLIVPPTGPEPTTQGSSACRTGARWARRLERVCRSHRSAQRSEDQGSFRVSMIAVTGRWVSPPPAPQVMSPSPALSSFFSAAGPAASPAGAGARGRPGAGQARHRRVERLRKEGLRGLGVCTPRPEETRPENPPSRHRRIASSRARPGGWGSGGEEAVKEEVRCAW
jgi:hypothetical protein